MQGIATTVVNAEMDGSRTLAVIGELDLATAPAIERELDSLSVAHHDVRIDVAAVQYIDASGVRALIRVIRRARERGHRLHVTRPLPRSLQRLVALTDVGPQLGL